MNLNKQKFKKLVKNKNFRNNQNYIISNYSNNYYLHHYIKKEKKLEISEFNGEIFTYFIIIIIWFFSYYWSNNPKNWILFYFFIFIIIIFCLFIFIWLRSKENFILDNIKNLKFLLDKKHSIIINKKNWNIQSYSKK